MYTVQDVHNDFMTAQDRILKDAQRIINSPQVDLSLKAERVNKLGFTNSKPSKIGLQVANNFQKSREIIDNITRYKQSYPLNKFITEDEVKRLCEKYNLLLADADRYTGDIPEKNIQEIERFKLKKEDFTEKPHIWRLGDMVSWGIIDNPWIIEDGRIVQSGQKKETKAEMYQAPFMIVAPEKDLNLHRSEIRGHKVENVIPDPIVLQPVKGGYLIVTAWGEEASDPIVVNETLN